MRVPPGMREADFRRALAEFERVVGAEWTFTSDADLELYRDAYSPLRGRPDELLASAAVAPDSTEQVQQIVRIANRYRIPLYPISTGRNLGYGGSAPAYTGSVVLDLKRMNRILEVNERNAYALVEPGVSYFDLYNHIRERGLEALDRLPGPRLGQRAGQCHRSGRWLHHGAVPQSFRRALRHGSGVAQMANCCAPAWAPSRMPPPGSSTSPAAARWIDGIFSQSNFGIVTKMGFWLMPEPEAYLRCTVSVPRYQDLIATGRYAQLPGERAHRHRVPGHRDAAAGLSAGGTGAAVERRRARPTSRPEHQATAGRRLNWDIRLNWRPTASQQGIPYWQLWVSLLRARWK